MQGKNFVLLLLIFFAGAGLPAQEGLPYETQAYAQSAQNAYEQGNLKQAEKYTRFTLRSLRNAGAEESKAYAEWASKYGNILLQMGRANEAREIYEKNADLVRRHFGEISFEYAGNRSALADALGAYHTKQAEEARLREEGFAIIKDLVETEDRLYFVFLIKAARAYQAADQSKKAIKAYQEALKIREENSGENDPGYAHDLLQLGVNYDYIGRQDKSIPLMRKAWEIFSRTAERDTPAYGIFYSHLTTHFMNTGDLPKALEFSRRSEEYYLANEADLPPSLGYTYLTRADIFKLQSRVDSAVVYYNTALEQMENTFGKESQAYHVALYATARYNQECGFFAYAEDQFRALENYYQKHPERLRNAEGLPEEGVLQCLQFQKKYKEAAEYFPKAQQKILSYYEPGSPVTTDLYSAGAEIFNELNQEEKAKEYFLLWKKSVIDYFANTLNNLSDKRQEQHFERNRGYLADLLEFTSRQSEPVYKNTAFDIALTEKGIRETLARRLSAFALSTEDSVTSDLYARRSATAAALALLYTYQDGQSSPEFAALNKTYTALGEQIAQQAAPLTPVQDLNYKDIQARLSRKEAALEIVYFNRYVDFLPSTRTGHYAALILKKDAPVEFIYLFEESELGNLNATRRLYAPERDEAENNLTALLGNKLKPYLNGIKKIYYSPVRLLHRINFSAVPYDENATFGEQFKLQLLTGSRDIAQKNQKNNKAKTAVLFGGIDYGKVGKEESQNRNPTWQSLPWAMRETQEISSLLTEKKYKTQVLTGQEAGEENFKKLGKDSPSPRILHLATHGYFISGTDNTLNSGIAAAENPLIRSGLILSNGNKARQGIPDPQTEEDGILTAYEVAQTDLRNTELVVLSACDTGLGDIKGNEGVYGLQRAFKTAGVRYILMSLWAVNDEKTYEFMTRFYALHLQEGRSIPEAYQITQSEMRRKYALPFNPRNWAGFILMTNGKF